MTEKLYYWAENLEGYNSDIDNDFPYSIEIKRLNFFIGKNNAGKSRFLRNLFINSTHTIPDFSFPNLSNYFTELKSIIESSQGTIWLGAMSSGENRTTLFKLINDAIDCPIFPRNRYKENYQRTIDQLSKVRIEYTQEFTYKVSEIQKYVNDFENNIVYEKSKSYIPILRGMRPVTEQENTQPYIKRAQKDYFSDTNKFNSNNIITGECLYNELKIHLLGEPEQRELIKDYEEKLSQYFFDNETVSLIPKHDQDVVNIKIGNDQQFPISQLGDGLQQAIILTYEAYIKSKDKEGKPETHAFFIEEPELHMHAGMVRQLMNFYLNETPHYYFFTTHSNHLLDMADESDQVMIQKFVKQPKEEDPTKFDFKIYRCDRDRDLLASLGVRPSSVYLANCTIWVEGITDRLYITKYMEKYLAELESADMELYKKFRRFMPNYHYTFVEYAGSNLSHWSFDDDYPKTREERIEFLKQDRGQSATAVASDMLLIADGDIQKNSEKIKLLRKELNKENLIILDCKETENTLPKDSILYVAQKKFSNMKRKTSQGFNIEKLEGINSLDYFDHKDYGIGKLLDDQIRNPRTSAEKTAFADGTGVGTIKYKLDFCREIIKYFDENPDWELTPKAKDLCIRIFKHIEKCNS
ncbi:MULTISPECIES: AAA family ATPase [unclassified Acinetobacter]|uniref:AAA family ATPase n=1 Tax=unclassified Acinetobacter TaxID=196816 RepID=UPI0015D3D817|nr:MULTISPECIES: AAA family ATPase [unclassified Acinetobacter]